MLAIYPSKQGNIIRKNRDNQGISQRLEFNNTSKIKDNDMQVALYFQESLLFKCAYSCLFRCKKDISSSATASFPFKIAICSSMRANFAASVLTVATNTWKISQNSIILTYLNILFTLSQSLVTSAILDNADSAYLIDSQLANLTFPAHCTMYHVLHSSILVYSFINTRLCYVKQ